MAIVVQFLLHWEVVMVIYCQVLWTIDGSDMATSSAELFCFILGLVTSRFGYGRAPKLVISMLSAFLDVSFLPKANQLQDTSNTLRFFSGPSLVVDVKRPEIRPWCFWVGSSD